MRAPRCFEVMDSLSALAALSLVIWWGLLFFRGRFWRADQRLAGDVPERCSWPAVVAIVPARDEAATIAKTVASLLAQDYPGDFQLIVIDDSSSDGTAENATAAAKGSDRLTVVAGASLERGWTGKLWAVNQGLARANDVVAEAPYVLLTDADIEHGPNSLRRLVNKAEDEGLDLVSLMVLLRTKSYWERLLIPAFVFFFQKLYPFPRVNDPQRTEAAAAGGCMLVRRAALERAGGLRAIRGEVIDDCALAALLKPGGPIWLGLSDRVRSLRAYQGLSDIWSMVARTAFTQLGHSALVLAGTIPAMVLIYLVPPLAAVFGQTAPGVFFGLFAWALMARAYLPTLRLYGQPPWRALLLPLAAFLYTAMTLDSAARHWRGRGGGWKGRNYG